MAAQQSSSRKGLVVFLLVLVVLVGGGYYVYSRGMVDEWKMMAMRKLGMAAAAEQPELDTKLGQIVSVTPWKDETIRMVDENGVLIAVEIPKGAVTETAEISVVALKPKSDSEAPTSGVMITPATLRFEKPVTMSFNYFFTDDEVDLTAKTAGVYRVEENAEKENVLKPVLPMQAVWGKNFLPVQIDQGGAYVWELSGEDQLYWAKELMAKAKPDDESVLAAALAYVNRGERWSIDAGMKIDKVVTEVMVEEEPDLQVLYAAKLVQDASKQMAWITQAQANPAFEEYLLYRCNLPESSYEDLVAALMLAGEYGNDELQELCRSKAEDKILTEAEGLLADKSSTVAQLVEVGEQIDIIGADGSARGAEARDQINVEFDKMIEKAVEEANKEAGIEYEDDPSNDDAREKGTYRSRDMSSTLPQELLGVGLAQAVGIDSWNEAELKGWAAETHQQVGALGEMVGAMCQMMREDLGGIPPEAQNECAYIEGGAMDSDLEKWEEDVGEYGEHVGQVQRGNVATSSGWWGDGDYESDYEIDNYDDGYSEGLLPEERAWDWNGDGELSDDEYDAMMDDYYQDDYFDDISNWDADGDGELNDEEWEASNREWEEHEANWGQ